MNDFNAQKELRDAPEDFTVIGTIKDGVPGFLDSAPENPLNFALGNVELSSMFFASYLLSLCRRSGQCVRCYAFNGYKRYCFRERPATIPDKSPFPVVIMKNLP